MRRNLAWTLVATALCASPVIAQDASLDAGLLVTQLVAEPAEVSFEAGTSTPLVIRALDASGNRVNTELRIRGRGVSYADGMVTATEGGTAMLIVSVVLPADATQQPATLTLPINVTWPAVATVEIAPLQEGVLYSGTQVRYGAAAFFSSGEEHTQPSFSWTTSNASVATVNSRGNVTAHAAGSVTLTASFDGVRGTVSLDVPALPATSLEIAGGS